MKEKNVKYAKPTAHDMMLLYTHGDCEHHFG